MAVFSILQANLHRSDIPCSLPLNTAIQLNLLLQPQYNYMYSAIQHACQTRPGLNYLVPQKWFQQLCATNAIIVEQKDFIFPPLNNSHLIDHFLIDMKQYIRDQFEVKCNYLKFDRVYVTSKPQDNINTKWRAIPPSLWKLFIRNNISLSQKNKNILTNFENIDPILTFLKEPNQVDYDLQTVQLSIVYCSKSTCHLFVGLIPQSANLITLVREIGLEMGFVQLQSSRINFPDKYAQKNYNFQQLQRFSVKDSPDLFLMAFNMERILDDQATCFRKKEQKNIQKSIIDQISHKLQTSNEAVAGDLLTMIDQSRDALNDGTLSTGAQTPFSFFGSQGYDLDRQYRANGIFRDKKPEQVQAMKALAKQAINSQLIMVPDKSLQLMQEELQKMAEQILQGLHAHKKKSKDKEKESNNNNQ